MNIEIHSLQSIQKLSKKAFESPTALISIGDADTTPPKFRYAPDYILRLESDDVRPSDIVNDSDKFFYKLFSERQASRIAEFVFEHKDIETIICQCEYGMSRSAAVAAAIKEYFNHDGITIFADENYCPNTYVFNLTLKALKKSGSD